MEILSRLSTSCLLSAAFSSALVAFFFCLFWLLLPERKTTIVHVNEDNKRPLTSEDILGSTKTRDVAKEILDKLEKENKHYYELLLIQTVAKYYLDNPESILGKTLYDAITEYRKEKESEVETKTSPTGNYPKNA